MSRLHTTSLRVPEGATLRGLLSKKRFKMHQSLNRAVTMPLAADSPSSGGSSGASEDDYESLRPAGSSSTTGSIACISPHCSRRGPPPTGTSASADPATPPSRLPLRPMGALSSGPEQRERTRARAAIRRSDFRTLGPRSQIPFSCAGPDAYSSREPHEDDDGTVLVAESEDATDGVSRSGMLGEADRSPPPQIVLPSTPELPHSFSSSHSSFSPSSSSPTSSISRTLLLSPTAAYARQSTNLRSPQYSPDTSGLHSTGFRDDPDGDGGEGQLDSGGYSVFSFDVSSSHLDDPLRRQSPGSPTTSHLQEATAEDLLIDSGAEALNEAAGGSGKDWNREYQELLCEEPSSSKFVQLHKLTQDFEYAAQSYARIIVSELPLPFEHKTIRPSVLGGIAGGAKYVVGGIVFKFALDSIIRLTPSTTPSLPPSELWMYGGYAGPSDAGAIKAAGLELLHFDHVIAQQVHGISTPLVCLVDYQGYRLMAITVLPISSETLRYGSNDGGKVVHQDDPQVTAHMDKLFKIYHLKPHVISASSVVLRGPGDIEGHVGHDSRLYLLDLARMMPPEMDIPSLRLNPRLVFSRLFRPEFMMRYGSKLSADAGTAWDPADPAESKRNIEEVKRATLVIYTKLVPGFAIDLLEEDAAALDYQADLSVDSVLAVLDRFSSGRFHTVGLNVRHIGRVREHVLSAAEPLSEQIGRILLCIAVARTMKTHAHHQMRKIHATLTVPSHHPFSDVVVQHLNLLLNLDHPGAARFWTDKIKRMAVRSFPHLLSHREQEPEHSLRSSICPLLTSICFIDLLGISVSTDLQSEIISLVPSSTRSFSVESIHVLSSDITEMPVRVKSLTFTSMWHAYALWFQSIDSSTSGNAPIRLLSVLSQHIAEIQRSKWAPMLSFKLAVVGTVRASLLPSKYPSVSPSELFADHLQPLLEQGLTNLERTTMVFAGSCGSYFGVSPEMRCEIIRVYMALLQVSGTMFDAYGEPESAAQCATRLSEQQLILAELQARLKTSHHPDTENVISIPTHETCSLHNLVHWLSMFYVSIDRLKSYVTSNSI